MCQNFKHPHVLFIMSLLVLLLVTTRPALSLAHQLAATHGEAGNGVVMNKHTIMCIAKERRALLGFKATTFWDPTVADCVSTWGTKKEIGDDDCCNWMGVTCNNKKGHVSSLDLYGCGLEVGRSLDTYDYVDQAMIQWQGIRREFTNNLGLLKSIDLSSNNLTGKIPNELTDLRGLLALNVLKNALLGEIPRAIGHMKELLILDLSRNNFSGAIPSSMSQLTSLYDLDVSYNNLSGRIPSSTQLQSFESSRYIGNAGLCGLPLLKYCPGDVELEVPSPAGERKGGDQGGTDELEKWFYIGGATGFAIGFWIVCITLLVISRGRSTFFHFLDILEEWVRVKVLVFKAKFE